MKSKLLIACILLLALITKPTNACTVVRFQIGDDFLVARNHDWMFGEGLIVVQPRGLTKKGISTVRPAKWTSRFGSVSFTQFGRGIPFAGMNEAGLTVDLLQLNTAGFPTARTLDRDSVNVIQWVQYQLDNSADTEEVIRSLDTVYPVPLIPAIERVHFFVTDASGGVAIVEFIGGKPVIRRGPKPIHCALANTDIQTSAKQYSAGDATRYGRAARSIANVQASGALTDASEKAFAVLDNVSQAEFTQWSLLYQPKQRRLTFHTAANPQQRWIDLSDFDLDEGSPTLAIDVHAPHQGNLRDHFRPITPEDNARIVNHAFDNYLPPGIGRMAVKQLILNYSTSVKASTR
ncbi:linear amide C-N hydrolase [Rubripirellula obstinata]|nr:linear amide C-N hydrolase [Rubripirellula obstinata]